MLGLVFLVGGLHGPRAGGRRVYGVLLGLAALGGIAIAIGAMVDIVDARCAAHLRIDGNKIITIVESRKAVIGNYGTIGQQAVTHGFGILGIAGAQIAGLQVADRTIILQSLQSFLYPHDCFSFA